MPADLIDVLLDAALRSWPDRPAKVVFRAQEALLLHEIGLPGPAVDLGCGNGEFAALVGRPVAVGVDRDEAACRRARRLGHHRQVITGDLAALPLPDAAFAGAFSNSTLEHVEHPEAVLREAARVLRPGGVLAVSVPTPRKREWLYFARYAESRRRDPPLAARYRDAYDRHWAHRHYFEPESLSALMTEAGLRVRTIVEYESRAVSELLDVLNPLRLSVDGALGEPVHELLTSATRHVLRQLLRPAVAATRARPGAGVFCVAVKPTVTVRRGRS